MLAKYQMNPIQRSRLQEPVSHPCFQLVAYFCNTEAKFLDVESCNQKERSCMIGTCENFTCEDNLLNGP